MEDERLSATHELQDRGNLHPLDFTNAVRAGPNGSVMHWSPPRESNLARPLASMGKLSSASSPSGIQLSPTGLSKHRFESKD